MSHTALIDARTTWANSDAARARARLACADASAACDDARSSCLQAIQVRYAARRLRRDIHGPIYAMAAPGADFSAAHGVEPPRVDDGHDRSRLFLSVTVGELVHGAIELGLDEADLDEGAVELLALCGRSRTSIESALHRTHYLQPGDDVDRAVALLKEALQIGDRHRHWVEI